jgi:hypothetical protein
LVTIFLPNKVDDHLLPSDEPFSNQYMDTIMSTVEEVSTYEEGIEEAIMWFVTDMIDKIDHDNDGESEVGVVLNSRASADHNGNPPDLTDASARQRKEKKDELIGAAFTYSLRPANLSNVVAHGPRIFRKIGKAPKRHKNRIQNEEFQTNEKRDRDSLLLWRRENGLTASTGFVKHYTRVLFNDTRQLQSFDYHPFFHTVPYACVRETLGNQPFVELRCLEKEILELLPASTKRKYTTHTYGANEGLNCGISFSGGGVLSNKESGISGTVQWSAFIKGRPNLRKRLCNLFQRILLEAFGACLWYKCLLHLTTKINSESGYERTLSGVCP